MKLLGKNITKRGIQRVVRGRKGISINGIEIARKNVLWLAKTEAREKSLRELRKQINALEELAKKDPEKKLDLKMTKIIIEAVEKGEAVTEPQFSRALKLQGTKLAETISLKYALDAVGEFNPETRKQVRKKMNNVWNALERKGIISTKAGNKALKDIQLIFGKRKTSLFLKKYNKTAKRLGLMLKRFLNSAPIWKITKNK